MKSDLRFKVVQPDLDALHEYVERIVSPLLTRDDDVDHVLCWAIPTTFVAITARHHPNVDDRYGTIAAIDTTVEHVWSGMQELAPQRRQLRWGAHVELVTRTGPVPVAAADATLRTRLKARYEANFKRLRPLLKKYNPRVDFAKALGQQVGYIVAAEVALTYCATDADAAQAVAIAVQTLAEQAKDSAL